MTTICLASGVYDTVCESASGIGAYCKLWHLSRKRLHFLAERRDVLFAIGRRARPHIPKRLAPGVPSGYLHVVLQMNRSELEAVQAK